MWSILAEITHAESIFFFTPWLRKDDIWVRNCDSLANKTKVEISVSRAVLLKVANYSWATILKVKVGKPFFFVNMELINHILTNKWSIFLDHCFLFCLGLLFSSLMLKWQSRSLYWSHSFKNITAGQTYAI